MAGRSQPHVFLASRALHPPTLPRSSRMRRSMPLLLRAALYPRFLAGAGGGSTMQQQQHAAARSTRAAAASTARPLVVLGIESSCDDTAAAVVTSAGVVLGEASAGQAEVHAPWGGVVPNLAAQAHRAAIDRVVADALAAAALTPEQLDAVAVTVGPGLSLCLDVGVRKARAVARAANKPLVPVHHMEAHALVARLAAAQQQARGSASDADSADSASSSPQQQQQHTQNEPLGGAASALAFPFLCLLVSGGHNLLLLVHGPGDYTQLGTTLDDALGEAYDKVARMLGLEAAPHGGAALEALARRGDETRFKFALPMQRRVNCDFSYAGLKTSVRMCIEKELGAVADGGGGNAPATLEEARAQAAAAAAAAGDDAAASVSSPASSPSSGQTRADIAASFQRVAVAHLVARVRRGVSWARQALEEGGGGGDGDGGAAAAVSPPPQQQQQPQLTQLVVAGGVACNKVVRASLGAAAAAEGLALVLPPPRWCTDNGVMVAWAGLERLTLGLAEPPPPPLVGVDDDDDDDGEAAAAAAATEWIDLHPRWPLTSRKHAGSTPQTLSMRAPSKMHTSLTDLTRAALAALRDGGGAGGAADAAASSERQGVGV